MFYLLLRNPRNTLDPGLGDQKSDAVWSENDNSQIWGPDLSMEWMLRLVEHRLSAKARKV